MSQYVEWSSPDVSAKIVSFIIREKRYTDTKVGIIIYVNITATPGNKIESLPSFVLQVTLGAKLLTDPIVRTSVAPTAILDTPMPGSIVKTDGTEESITIPLNQLSTFPLLQMEGHLYFEITKTREQYVLSANLKLT